MKGWIKLHRKILDNGIFTDANLLKVFIWCLIKANSSQKNKNVYNAKIKQGQFITGRTSASEELYMKPSTVHDRLKKLQTLGYIKIKSTTKYTIISVLKYSQYQIVAETPKVNIELRQLSFVAEAREHFDKYSDDMIKEFVSYWTEPNKSKTKMRFELQRTWDMARRLATWKRNSKDEKQNIFDTWQEARNMINNG